MSTPVPFEVPNTAQVDTPAALMCYQQRWVADPSPLKVIEKSRRTGLTWAEAADDVLTAAAAKSAGGQNVYYIAYNQDMTIEYIQAAAMWARVFNRAASEIEEGIWSEEAEDRNIKTFTITFPDSGHRIVALSSRPSNLRGRQGIIVIDEAAFHEQLGELLKAALAMLIWGGKVRVISTHNGTENPFNELVNDIRAGKRKGSVHRVEFREAVVDGLYQRVCLRLGINWTAEDEAEWMSGVYDFYGDGASEELDCVPANGGGKWLSLALLEARMSPDTPVLRWTCPQGFELLADDTREWAAKAWLGEHVDPLLAKLPRDARSYFGQDFARKTDLTAMAPLLLTKHLVRRAPFLIELRNTPYRQQEQILNHLLDRLPGFAGGALDAGGNGGALAEFAMQRYGSGRIHQVMLSEAWYRENMPPMKAALEDGTLTDLPRDKDVLDDFRAFELIRGVPRIPDRRSKGADGGKRHGDTGIAYGLAHYASRVMDGSIPAGEEVPANHDTYRPDSMGERTANGLFQHGSAQGLYRRFGSR